MAMDLTAWMMGCPTDIAGFEKDMSNQITNASHTATFIAQDQDMESLIADALKRRCCSSGNNRKAAMHMHMRLKRGANQNAAQSMSRHELADLAEMIASKNAVNAIINRLANFYVRIAKLRAHIEEAIHSLDTCALDAFDNGAINVADATHLRTAHEKNEESMREKRNENQRELSRIMNELFLESDIHPALTEDDLPALEMQTQHIAERGCTTQELRRLKIMEAVMELKRYNALVSLI